MKRILLTGSDGFIGAHLASYLREEGHQLICPNLPDFDLLNSDSVRATILGNNFDTVIHLAGMSHVMDCENNKSLAFATNVTGTKILLEALKAWTVPVHFIFASTAQVYEAPKPNETEVVFNEDRAIKPQNYYAETKFQAEQLIKDAVMTGNSQISATILRLFNHSHKTQAPTFFLPHLYRQINSGVKSIPVGNLDLHRDIGSVHDLVRAISLVVNQRNWQLEVFNVCSGHGKNLRKLANLLAQKMKVEVSFITEPSRIREGEPTILIGSHGKLTKKLGWNPLVVTEEQLIEDFLCE